MSCGVSTLGIQGDSPTSCTCPYFSNSECVCKHIAALLLAYRRQTLDAPPVAPDATRGDRQSPPDSVPITAQARPHGHHGHGVMPVMPVPLASSGELLVAPARAPRRLPPSVRRAAGDQTAGAKSTQPLKSTKRPPAAAAAGEHEPKRAASNSAAGGSKSIGKSQSPPSPGNAGNAAGAPGAGTAVRRPRRLNEKDLLRIATAIVLSSPRRGGASQGSDHDGHATAASSIASVGSGVSARFPAVTSDRLLQSSAVACTPPNRDDQPAIQETYSGGSTFGSFWGGGDDSSAGATVSRQASSQHSRGGHDSISRHSIQGVDSGGSAPRESQAVSQELTAAAIGDVAWRERPAVAVESESDDELLLELMGARKQPQP